jgi:hypothetical protein
MIPLYTLNLLTFGARQERRVVRDVGLIVVWGWLVFLLVVLVGGL